MNLFTPYLIHNRKQRGVGLLEILIALAISAIMLVAITSVYGGFIEASTQQKEQSLAQDQANFAFLSLNRAVRMSGAGICVRPTLKTKTYFHQEQSFDTFPPLLDDYPKPKNPKTTNPSPRGAGLTKFSANSRLHSFANPSKDDLGILLDPMPDSDALFVLYSDSNTRRINAVVSSSGAVLSPQEASIYNDRRFAENRSQTDDIIFYNDSSNNPVDTWVMVSDCEHTGVYKYTANSLNGKALNLLPSPDTGGKGFLYNFSGNGQESLASRLYGKLFFVAKSSNGIPHLYVKDLLSPNRDAQPIAAYVQKMKVEFLNLSTNAWVDTASRGSWDQNWPVRITLTMYAGNRNPVPAGDERIYTRILDIRN